MTYRQIVRLIIVVALIQLGIVLLALGIGGYFTDQRSCERQIPVHKKLHLAPLDCGSFPPGK